MRTTKPTTTTSGASDGRSDDHGCGGDRAAGGRDGQWFVVSSNNNIFPSSSIPRQMTDRVQHIKSGMIMSLEPGNRLVYHNQSKGCYFATDGSRIEMTTDDDTTVLHSDLLPVLPELNQSMTRNIEHNNAFGNTNTNTIDHERELCLLTDKHRPPGTLPGGKWFHQSVLSKKDVVESTEEKKVDDTAAATNVRLIYQDTDGKGVHRYYTQEGNEVSISQEVNLQMVHSSVHGSSTSTKSAGKNTDPATATSAVTSQQNSSNNSGYNSYNNNTKGLIMRGPPGSKPGGKWFKQIYKGSKTQTFSNLMCCMHGLAASAIASNVPMDERFVYRNPSVSVCDGKTYQFFNMAGGAVHPFQGTFHPLPDETCAPMGYYNAEGKVVGVPTPTANAPSRYQEKEKHQHPPGTSPNGDWYKERITGGKSRYVYRDAGNEGKWFDVNGKLVHPDISFLQPPVVNMNTNGTYS